MMARPLRLLESGENMVFSSQLCVCALLSLRFAVLLAVKGCDCDVLFGESAHVSWPIVEDRGSSKGPDPRAP